MSMRWSNLMIMQKRTRHCEEAEGRRGNPLKIPESFGDCHASVCTGSQ